MSATTIKIRVDSAELDSWRSCAAKSELSLSEWMRKRCNGEGHLKSVEHELRKAGMAPALSNMGEKRSPFSRKKSLTPAQIAEKFPSVEVAELEDAPPMPALSENESVDRGGGGETDDLHAGSTPALDTKPLDWIEETVARKVGGHRLGCHCYACDTFRRHLKASAKPKKEPEEKKKGFRR